MQMCTFELAISFLLPDVRYINIHTLLLVTLSVVVMCTWSSGWYVYLPQITLHMSDQMWYENPHLSESLKTERWPFTKIGIFTTVFTYTDAHYFLERREKSLIRIRPISFVVTLSWLAAEEAVLPPWLHCSRRSFTHIFMADLIISLDFGWLLIRHLIIVHTSTDLL